VQSPATLCVRCVRAVCALYHHIERHAGAIFLNMLKNNAAVWRLQSEIDIARFGGYCGNAVGSSRALWARCGCAACTL